jgi:hypothetical protein
MVGRAIDEVATIPRETHADGLLTLPAFIQHATGLVLLTIR